jgi:hypothetical protein
MTKKNVGEDAEGEMESLGHLGSKQEKVAGGGKGHLLILRRPSPVRGRPGEDLLDALHL